MSKRFTEINKWEDGWFRKLPLKMKLFWTYINDRCDPAGIWPPDFELASVYIGERVEHLECVSGIDGRFRVLPNGNWFLVGFILFQYGALSKQCIPHRQVYESLMRNGLRYPKDILTVPLYPIGKGRARVCNTLQDKDTDKDKGKEEDRTKTETLRDLPVQLLTSRVLAKWGIWMNHRRAFKAPGSWVRLFNEQIEWLTQFDEPTVFEILSASIRNGWQGLFKPKNAPVIGEPPAVSGVDKMNFGKELERVLARKKQMRDSVESHSSMAPEDLPKWLALVTREKELKQILGVKM